MIITPIMDVAEANEVNLLSDSKYREGFYVINDQIWLKDKTGLVAFIWSNLQSYFNENIYLTEFSPELEVQSEPQRGDTISEEFLLKVHKFVVGNS